MDKDTRSSEELEGLSYREGSSENCGESIKRPEAGCVSRPPSEKPFRRNSDYTCYPPQL